MSMERKLIYTNHSSKEETESLLLKYPVRTAQLTLYISVIKNQSVIIVQDKSRCLFSYKKKTACYRVKLTYRIFSLQISFDIKKKTYFHLDIL
jgi:hypothetical protein